MRNFAMTAAVAALGLGAVAQAAVVGTDNASAAAYADGWQTGDNGAVTGNAFNAWNLVTTTPANSFAGHFIGDSTQLSGGTGADLNTNGSSFGLYANPTGSVEADAFRTFNGALAAGQTFSVNLGVNFRNGNKGMNLQDAGGNTLFTLNVGGDDYTVYDASSGTGSIGNAYSSNTAFNLSFTQTTATGGTFTINRTGGVTGTTTGTYNGVASGIKLYENGTDTGDGSNNLFANSLSISGAVPEPASLGLLGVAAVGLLRRRK